MNITFGKRKGLIYCGIICLFSALVACEKKSILFEEELANSFTDIVLIDTLTPELSTYKLDSFPTSGTGAAFTGGYNDPVFGKINASSFFQLALPSFDVPLDAIYDSLTFIVRPDGEYYGDTTIPQQLSVHELQADIALASDQTGFYNTKTLPSQALPLGSRQISVRPAKKDAVEIRLSDAKGVELFNHLRQKTTEVQTQEDFLRYFRGIELKAAPSPSALVSYQVKDTSLKMRIYYRERGLNFTSKYLDFPVTSPGLQFNHVTVDRTGTPLQNLPAHNPELPSSQLGNAAYVQYGSGLIGKLMFPTLQNLLNIDKNGKILKAELIIKPLPNSFVQPYRLPAALNLSITDRTNVLGPVVATTELFTDNQFAENTGYTFDITSFMQQQIATNVANSNGLLIYSPFTTTFNRLMIGDQTTGKSKVQLKIYYLVIK